MRTPRHTVKQTGVEPVNWHAKDRRFSISLRGVSIERVDDQNRQVNIHFEPPILFDIRVRKVGEEFGVGFLSPLSAVTIIGTEQGAEYELRRQAIDAKTGEPVPGTQPDIQHFQA